jgi:hypothetical protein
MADALMREIERRSAEGTGKPETDLVTVADRT